MAFRQSALWMLAVIGAVLFPLGCSVPGGTKTAAPSPSPSPLAAKPTPQPGPSLPDWVAPSFAYTFLPGETPQIMVAGKVGGKVTVTVTPVDIRKWLEGKYKSDGAAPLVNLSVSLPKPKPGDKTPILDIDKPGQENRIDWGRKQYVRASKGVRLPKLKPGAYVVSVRGAQTAQRQKDVLLLISNLGVITQGSPDKSLIRTVRLDSGMPVPDTTLTVAYEDKMTEGKTDADGIFVASWNSRISTIDTPRVIATQGENIAVGFGASRGNYGYEPARGKILYFQTDRPLYRPGQTMSFKGILRERTTEGYESAPNISVDMTITGPDGSTLLQRKVTTDASGTFTGDVPLPDDAALGAYNVSMNTTDLPGQTEQFTVAKYRKPEYLVSVKPGKSVTLSGETFTAEVTASYYFGAPVVGASVRYSVYAQPDYWWWRNEDETAAVRDADFPGVNEDDQPIFRPYNRYPGYRGMMRSRSEYGGFGGYYGPRLKEGTAKTDKDGKIHISLPAKIEKGQWDEMARLRYVVQCTVMDSSRQQVEASGEGQIAPSAVFVRINQDRWGAMAGEKITFTLATKDAQTKKGISCPVKLAATRARSIRVWRKDGRGRSYESWEYKTDTVDLGTVTTDATGQGQYIYTVRGSGSYTIRASTVDSKKRPAAAIANIWVHDEKDPYDVNQGFRITADKKRYYPGDTATLLINAPDKEADAWLTIVGRKNVVNKRVPIAGHTAVVKIPLAVEDAPNVQVTISYVKDRNFQQISQFLPLSPRSHLLHVRVTPAKEKYRPGDTAQFTVKTTDRDGKPVAAEVAVGVSDASLFSLAADATDKIEEAFWSPLYLASEMRFSYSRLPMGLSTGRLEDQNTYYSIYDFDRETDGLLKTESETNKRRLDTGTGYYYSAGRPANIQRQSAFASTTRTVAGALSPPASTESSSEARADMSANRLMYVAHAKAKAADSSIAGEDTSGGTIGGGIGGEALPLVIRSDFRDSAYWSPSVKTDSSGVGTVEFKLPDNLTSWKVTARAISADSKVGATTQETETSQDLIARLAAPRFATQGDDLILSGIIHNYTDKTVTAQVRLTSDGPGLALKENGANRTVTIAPGEEQRINWQAQGAQIGVTNLTLTADAGSAKDGMEIPLPTLPYGSFSTVASSGSLPKTGITKAFVLPAGGTAFQDDLKVMVAPSLLSVALGGAEDIAHYPYGCIEQTLSKFVPNLALEKLLKERNLPHPQKDELPKMAKVGLNRVYSLQLPDGGWGFGYKADPYFTAIAVESLMTAKECGYKINEMALHRGIRALRQSANQLNITRKGKNTDNWEVRWNLQRKARAYYALALAQGLPSSPHESLVRLWQRRDEMEPTAIALLTRAAVKTGLKEMAAQGAALLRKKAGRGSAGAFWKQDESYYIERNTLATAEAIRTLLAVDKNDPLIKEGLKYLVGQRQGRSWYTTNDTAAVLYAAVDYERAFPTTQDTQSGANIIVNGKTVQTVRFTDKDLFKPEVVVKLDPTLLPTGRNEVSVQPLDKDDNPVYYALSLRYRMPLPPGQFIQPIVAGIRVERTYLKRVPKEIVKARQNNPSYYWGADNWQLVPFGNQAKPGDEVLVKLTVNSDSPLGYVVIEDFMPAGCEPADQIDADGSDSSRYGTSQPYWRDWGFWGRRETHDERVAFLGERLSRGKTVLTYRLRVITPGTFNAVPARAFAMYLPEIRGSATSARMAIRE